MKNTTIRIQQMEQKIMPFAKLKQVNTPPTGWVKAIRTALDMTMQQLANQLNKSSQSVNDIERREKDGSITIKALREAANGLDMDLVYGLVPRDGSLENLIDRKARELATEIVMRVNNTMVLENQENSKHRIKKAIEERTIALKYEMPKVLWD